MQPMFCRRCRYNLYGLTTHACPECGLAFDPQNPRTYLKSEHTRLPYEVRFVLVWQSGVLLVFAALEAFSRLHVLGMDVWTAAACSAVILGVFVQLFLTLYGVIAAVLAWRVYPPWRRAKYTAVLLAPPVITLVLFTYYSMVQR